MTDKVELKKAILTPNGEVRMIDWAGAINLLPLEYGLIGKMGVFDNRFGTQKDFFVTKRIQDDMPLLEDRNWETTRPTLARQEYTGVKFPIGHYPVADMIMPSDIDGLANVESLVPGTEMESVARLRTEKIDRIRKVHTQFHEFVRGYALTTGKVYAPNGTLKTSYGTEVDVYAEWGITRGTAQVDLTVGTNPLSSVNALFGELQGRARSGDALTGYVVLCGKTFFQDLITNEYISEIFAQAQLLGRQSLLVGRLGNELGLDARYRSFDYGGVLFVEAPDVIGGRPVVAANKGVAFPLGTKLGRLHFAPPNRFDTLNRVSQASYLWEKMGEDQDKLELTSETNVSAVLDRPDLVIDVTYVNA